MTIKTIFAILLICSTSHYIFAQNTLTKKEKKEGWQLLFDGKTMAGWRYYQHKPGFWKVEDGSLHCTNVINDKKLRSDLITEKTFANFILTFDWKLTPGGNSGVMYRVTEQYNEPYQSGPEYQVADNEGYKGEMTVLQTTASAYDMYGNFNAKAKPVGEWNQSKIIVDHGKIEHWLNGALAVKYEILSPDWLTRKAKSKWEPVENYAKSTYGHIDLQDHGYPVWYRNIKMLELK